MSPADILIIVILIAVVVGVIHYMRKKPGCGYNCPGCSGCAHAANCQQTELMKKLEEEKSLEKMKKEA